MRMSGVLPCMSGVVLPKGPRSVVHPLHCVGILWAPAKSSTSISTVFWSQVLHISMTSHSSHSGEGPLLTQAKKWNLVINKRVNTPPSPVLGWRGSGSSCIMHLSTSQLSQRQINLHCSTFCFAKTNIMQTPSLFPAHKHQNSFILVCWDIHWLPSIHPYHLPLQKSSRSGLIGAPIYRALHSFLNMDQRWGDVSQSPRPRNIKWTQW